VDGAEITFKGWDTLMRGFSDLQEKMSAPKPFLDLVGAEMRSDMLEAFRNREDPVTGDAWKPMMNVTRNARRGKGQGAKELYDTGQLAMAVNAVQPVQTHNDTVELAVLGGRTGNGNIGISELANIHNGPLTGMNWDKPLIIRPVRARFLTIPATPEAKKYASAREFMQKNRRNGARFVFTGKHSGLIVMPKTRKSRKKGAPPTEVATDIYYFLTDKVEIPRRRFMGMYDDLKQRFNLLVFGEVVQTFKDAKAPITDVGGGQATP
jgi:phage gpG-like protein